MVPISDGDQLCDWVVISTEQLHIYRSIEQHQYVQYLPDSFDPEFKQLLHSLNQFMLLHVYCGP